MDTRVGTLSPSTGRLVALGVPAAFVLMVAVAKLPAPWWQRLLGPLFAAAGFFPWVALRHGLRRAPASLRPWIFLAAGGLVFLVLRVLFPPLPPPPPDPFIERLPVMHLDWHTRLFSWAPWPFFLHAFGLFSRSFVSSLFSVPLRVVAALPAIAGMCASLPGVLLPGRNWDFAVQFPAALLLAAVFAFPALAKNVRKA